MPVRWRYLTLLLAGCLWGSSAMAETSPSTKLCRASATNLIVQIIRKTPDVHVYEFRGLDAEIGIALYNSLPPVGHLHGDRFYILMKPGAPISHLMIGNADCLQDTATVDPATAGIIKKAIERAAAASSI